MTKYSVRPRSEIRGLRQYQNSRAPLSPTTPQEWTSKPTHKLDGRLLSRLKNGLVKQDPGVADFAITCIREMGKKPARRLLRNQGSLREVAGLGD